MRALRTAALTTALLVLTATAALAHPSLNPNQVPVGEPIDTTLVIPHGCSTGEGVVPEDEDEAVATVRFDLQQVDGITLEPGEVDGWQAEDDGEAIVWTDDGGATTDVIELPLTLTVEEGSAGDELALAGYQECEDGSSYRWTADSDSTPAIALELTEGETGTAEMDMEGMEHDHDESEDMSEMAMTESASPTEEASAADETTTDEPTTDDPTTAAESDLAADEGGSNAGWIVAIVALVLLAIAGGTLVARRRSA